MKHFSGGYLPAAGLRQLTWAQVEQIDQLIAAMCQDTAGDRSAELHVVIVVRNGKPQAISEPLKVARLKPDRE